MFDLVCSFALLAVAASFAVGCYVFRAAGSRTLEESGPEPEGGSARSAMFGSRAIRSLEWALAPAVSACVAARLSANAVTAVSAFAGACAGAAVAARHFGLGAVLVSLASAGDALDGLVARRTGTASATGALLDAAVDRYQELVLLGALALVFRDRPLVLAMAMGALGGSFMVSYGSAKAEALRIAPPRGILRRAERAVVLGSGLLLCPIAGALARALVVSGAGAAELADAPIVAAMAVVAVVGNASAIRRLAAVGAAADRITTRGQRASAAATSTAE
jgi:phosphatidylglycerophosphate synthase